MMERCNLQAKPRKVKRPIHSPTNRNSISYVTSRVFASCLTRLQRK